MLCVRSSNQAAERVYTKAGFRAKGLLEEYYYDPVETGVLMIRDCHNSDGCECEVFQ